MHLMQPIPSAEWHARLLHLSGFACGKWYPASAVDNHSSIDARLEMYLLGRGEAELAEWIACVVVVSSLSEDERRSWAGVWAHAVEFLKRAIGEVRG